MRELHGALPISCLSTGAVAAAMSRRPCFLAWGDLLICVDNDAVFDGRVKGPRESLYRLRPSPIFGGSLLRFGSGSRSGDSPRSVIGRSRHLWPPNTPIDFSLEQKAPDKSATDRLGLRRNCADGAYSLLISRESSSFGPRSCIEMGRPNRFSEN